LLQRIVVKIGMCEMVDDYKTCEKYTEGLSDLFDNDPNITVVGCKVNGIKCLCANRPVWNKCLVSRHDAFYRYKYRLQDRVTVHSQLFHEPYDRNRDELSYKDYYALPQTKKVVYPEEYYL
jgi:hypothetical protein